MAAAHFLERSKSAQGHGVVDRRNQRASWRRSPQIPADRIEAMFKLAFSVHVHHGARIEARQYLRQTGDSACDAQLRQRSGYRKFEKQQHLDVSVPVFFCPTAQGSATNHSGAIVVGAEENCPWMWNLDRNDRNVGFKEFGRDDGRDVLVGLELEHETNSLFN